MAAHTPDRWGYTYGDFASRRLLYQQYGGSTITGIVPSAISSHVLLFNAESLPGSGWRQDGFYYYAGATPLGSGTWEKMPVNEAIETAWTRGWRLRLLEAPRGRTRGLWRFVDSFMLDGVAEERTTLSPEGTVLRYPVYRLRSIENVTHHPGRLTPPGDPRRVQVRRVERCDLLRRDAGEDPMADTRPETRLSKAFERFVMSQGYAVHRLGIRHTAGCSPLVTDVWVAQLGLLIEAKAGKNPVDDVRYALGQLGHYTRHRPGVLRKAVLLPRDPGQDLRETALYMGVDLIWPKAARWCTTGEWGRLAGMEHASEV